MFSKIIRGMLFDYEFYEISRPDLMLKKDFSMI